MIFKEGPQLNHHGFVCASRVLLALGLIDCTRILWLFALGTVTRDGLHQWVIIKQIPKQTYKLDHSISIPFWLLFSVVVFVVALSNLFFVNVQCFEHSCLGRVGDVQHWTSQDMFCQSGLCMLWLCVSFGVFGCPRYDVKLPFGNDSIRSVFTPSEGCPDTIVCESIRSPFTASEGWSNTDTRS
jgi:hypothetical protein